VKWLGAWLIVWVWLVSSATAENWTVQTVAFPQEQDALSERDRLLSLGFQAYTEATSSEGIPYTRVRVGCYYSLEGAELVANSLLAYTTEAVVVEKTATTLVQPCFDHVLGVILPEAWGVHAQEYSRVIFWLEYAGHQIYLSFDQDWHLSQTLSEMSVTAAQPDPGPAVDFYVWEDRLWARTSDQQSYVVGQGVILWQNGQVAVVQTPMYLLAIRIK
jgi:hypothetical protein